MSVNALKPTLSAIRADGHITLEEAKTLTNPNKGLGVNTDKDEFEVFKRLSADVKVGNQLENPAPETVKEVNRMNKERLVDKGVRIGAGVGPFVGIGTAIASFMGLASWGGAAVFGGHAVAAGIGGVVWAFPVAIGLALAVAGITIGIGALAGYIHSRRNPITAGEIKRKTPLALAAAKFKKNPLVQRGIKIAGIIGGSISAVFAVSGTTLAIGVGIGGGAALAGGALLGFGAPAIGVLGLGVAVLIGLGALGGYIHSKIKGDNSVTPVTADPEAAKLIKETVDKGVTTKDHVKKGTKIGGIVGGVLGGLTVGGWAAITAGLAATAGAEGAAVVLAFSSAAFLPVGLGVLAGIAVCVGFGALCGFIHSKVKKQKD